MSLKQKEKVVSKLIKNVYAEKKIVQQTKKSLLLSQKKGKQLTVRIGQKNEKEEVPISAADISKTSIDYGLSLNQGCGVAKNLRSASRKRTMFEPNLKSKLQEIKHTLDSRFTKKNMFEFEIEFEKK